MNFRNVLRAAAWVSVVVTYVTTANPINAAAYAPVTNPVISLHSESWKIVLYPTRLVVPGVLSRIVLKRVSSPDHSYVIPVTGQVSPIIACRQLLPVGSPARAADYCYPQSSRAPPVA